ncbi:MAG TPA: hypothetical protein PK488_02060, partial [Bacillota bacterium]|nr:hypothetical protein [Bacillota bacterium]
MLQLLAERTLATAAGGMSRVGEFEELMRKHQTSVYNAALRMTGNAEDAKELRAKANGRISRDDRDILLVYEIRDEHEYAVPPSARLLVAEGQKITSG